MHHQQEFPLLREWTQGFDFMTMDHTNHDAQIPSPCTTVKLNQKDGERRGSHRNNGIAKIKGDNPKYCFRRRTPDNNGGSWMGVIELLDVRSTLSLPYEGYDVRAVEAVAIVAGE